MARSKTDERLFAKFTLDSPSHPKLEGAPAGTKWLWYTGIIVGRREMRDGLIKPAVVVAEAEVPTRHFKDLVGRGLWHLPGHDCARCVQPPKGRAVVHDFLEHQSSKADVEAVREVRSAAGRRGANARWHSKGDSKPHSNGHDTSDGKQSGRPMAEREGEGEGDTSSTPVSPVTKVPPGLGLTDEEVDRIKLRVGCDRPHAIRVASLILSKASGDVNDRFRYIQRAIDADPKLYAPTQTAGHASEHCPKHPGKPATHCGGCAADARAVD